MYMQNIKKVIAVINAVISVILNNISFKVFFIINKYHNSKEMSKAGEVLFKEMD